MLTGTVLTGTVDDRGTARVHVMIVDTATRQAGSRACPRRWLDPLMGDGIAAWIAVRDASAAVEFYRAAFGAVEDYRLDGDDGGVAVARLAIGGTSLWVGQDDDPPPGGPVRLILSVDDPDAVLARAVGAGATVVFPVEEQYGFRTGRLTDPFGVDWETSREL
jgi:PhnB protein